MMDRAEIREVLDRVVGLWPTFEVTEVVAEAWLDLLGPWPKVEVDAAIKALACEGREFAPPPGVVYRWVADERRQEAMKHPGRRLPRVQPYHGPNEFCGDPDCEVCLARSPEEKRQISRRVMGWYQSSEKEREEIDRFIEASERG